jgi:N-acyl homoserine lactone hydrolase
LEKHVAKLKVYQLPLLKLTSDHQRLMYLSNIVEPNIIFASIFYIEGAKQKILVDAGGSAEALKRRGLPVELLAYPGDALRKVGVTPDEIDLIICTHLHIDHNAHGPLYKKARFIVQKRELESALNPHIIEAPIYAPRESFANLDYEIIDGDTQVVDGIQILFTPGHTSGGQSVALETEKGKLIISGLCTTRNNFSPQKLDAKSDPVIPPSIHQDVRAAYDSLLRIKKEADIVIPLHSTEFEEITSY